MSQYSNVICWLRRDLRLHDHTALYHALKLSSAVHCAFVFDTDILNQLPNRADRRVEFIWHSVQELQLILQQQGSDLHILHGSARQLIPQLACQLNAQAVFANHDYEPQAIARDREVGVQLAEQGVAFLDFKDQVIFERDEVLTGVGTPFSVFTPYKNAWLKKLDDFYLRSYPTERYFSALAHFAGTAMPNLNDLGFQETNLSELALPCGMSGAAKLFADFQQRIHQYQARRDFPAVKGVSYLSTHLRFGTISIRALARAAYYMGGEGAQTWLTELIWRDFYQMLLFQHPRVVQHAFKPQFEHLAYTNNPDWFFAWKNGMTGYPLVDAGMRQMNQTGFMHNRLRMITASFLVKDLQIDWRWGERYFAEKLIDFDLAANNGGWQWAASTGCDAQPWFRIFNPVTQSERFDAEGKFIRRYVPELKNCPDKYIHKPWLLPVHEQQRQLIIGSDYPAPIIDHAVAREKTLHLYGQSKAPSHAS
ncbi:MAG: deoxyribodipyrimidine photo-lyase [Methylophilaceae bacterium]|nr:deoxyribodipyrimidine photo-lyase [Methylophilaceae bacterium]